MFVLDGGDYSFRFPDYEEDTYNADDGAQDTVPDAVNDTGIYIFILYILTVLFCINSLAQFFYCLMGVTYSKYYFLYYR